MSTFLAILKALPIIASIIDGMGAMFDKWQESQIKKHYEKKAKVRRALIEKVKVCKDDEELKKLNAQLAIIDSVY